MNIKEMVETAETIQDITTAPQEFIDRYNELINEGYDYQTAFDRTNFEYTFEQSVSIVTSDFYHKIAFIGVPVGVVFGGITGGILTFETGAWGAYPGAIIGGAGAYTGAYYGLTIPTDFTAEFLAEQLGQKYYSLTPTYITSTTFYMNNDGTLDVNTTIPAATGYSYSNNLKTLLEDMGFDYKDIKIQTDITDQNNIEWIANNLNSLNPNTIDITSPQGHYILDSDGSNSLTGSERTISGINGHTGEIYYNNDGNDTIYGNGGADLIYGNSGNDSIYGNEGNDLIYGDLARRVGFNPPKKERVA